MQAPWWWPKTETCRSDIYMYFNVNFNVFFKLINVHLLMSELYKHQNARCNNKNVFLYSHCCYMFFSSTKWISPYLFIHMSPLMNTVNTSPLFEDWGALLPCKVHTAVWFTHSLTILPPLHLNSREAFWKCSNVTDRTSGIMTYIGMPRRWVEKPSNATVVSKATNSWWAATSRSSQQHWRQPSNL